MKNIDFVNSWIKQNKKSLSEGIAKLKSVAKSQLVSSQELAKALEIFSWEKQFEYDIKGIK